MSGGMEFAAVILAAGLVVAVLVGVRLLSRDARLKRKIRAATPTTVAAALPGATVRLSGVIEAHGEARRAPITGRTCVYYLARLLVHQSSGKHGRWDEMAREEHGVEFRLRDATGAMRIALSGAEIALVLDHNTASGTFDDPTEIEAAFLARHRRSATNMFGLNLSYRYIEGALEVGEAVGVLGTVHEVDGERLLRAAANAPLLISDDPSTLAPR